MKCQSVKRFKNTQLNHTFSGQVKGKHWVDSIGPLAQGEVDISKIHQLKIEDQNMYSMRQETRNVHRPTQKLSGSDLGPSPSSSPTFGSFYAGAKFSGAPSPTDLPKPPSHWTNAPLKMSSGGIFPLHGRADNHHDFASRLKILVNAPA